MLEKLDYELSGSYRHTVSENVNGENQAETLVSRKPPTCPEAKGLSPKLLLGQRRLALVAAAIRKSVYVHLSVKGRRS